MSNQTPAPSLPNTERNTLLAKAMASVARAIPTAEADTERPAFHFHSPAYWINDPNGPIYDRGWFHLFYQFNPYGDAWGNMHWGHARSRNLVDWEHLPIALWPSKSRGEEHVFSGSTFRNGQGQPVLFYTSIGNGREPEQWAAMPENDDMLTFQKPTTNPLLTLAAHGGESIHEWRDPFVFSEGRETYMVVGGGRGTRGVVLLYQAVASSLSEWRYKGVLFEHPDAGLRSVECPNLFRLGNRWVLLTSTHGKIESFVGSLDVGRGVFTTQNRGVVMDGAYASQIVRDAKGRYLLLAWFQPPHAAGWAGCMTLPGLLSVSTDGTLICQPFSNLARLREKALITLQNRPLTGTLDLSGQTVANPHENQLEAVLEIQPGTASSVGVRLRVSPDGARAAVIRYDVPSHTLHTPDRVPVTLPPTFAGKPLTLHLFLDKTVLEVYAANGAVTQITAAKNTRPNDKGMQIFAEGGQATLASLDLYSLKPARFDRSDFR